MAINPAQQREHVNSAATRANELNDPQFENQQGYFPYDLTHQEFISSRYGEVIPTLHVDTAPADRMVVKDNIKSVLTQINGNFLSTINQYVDSFYVPLRSVFPNNYEKLIPNPTKGQDLPNSALPQVPFSKFIIEFLSSDKIYSIYNAGTSQWEVPVSELNTSEHPISDEGSDNRILHDTIVGRRLLLATILSRGQLLDYLGVAFDELSVSNYSELQSLIDKIYTTLYQSIEYNYIDEYELDLTSDSIDFGASPVHQHLLQSDNNSQVLSNFRSAISDCFERGHFPRFRIDYESAVITELDTVLIDFDNLVYRIFYCADLPTGISAVDTDSNPFQLGHLSLVKPLAYQQCIAQYFSEAAVDNIYDSDLYMQLLRSVLYPAIDNVTNEPTFNYNGVATEYDLISYGGFYRSLIDPISPGSINRQFVFATLMFLMRRSIRYGDYFRTARPRMLAVGQLEINVTDGKVSPIDVTKNLLMQRYLNAANYTNSGFLQYYASMYGVTPSDTGSFPRFIAHRKIEMEHNITNNTADNQGAQTTNLLAFTDDTAFDVFIDDFGVILSVTSYDVLPVYKSGIDNSYHLADRFDFFNPMLQGIGDQPIYLSELIGNPRFRDKIFGYTMRNAQYKYKTSRAHGAFVNSLPGFMLGYPTFAYTEDSDGTLHIDPDFIRDKPLYLDAVVPQMTGISPADYYHFILSCTNQVQCARKMQATPPVLF